jgi:hypothetical protein
MIASGLAIGRTSLLFGRDVMIHAAAILPARSLPIGGNRIKSVGNDHCLFDERGNLLGTIASAHVPPVFARNAPTFFLRVKRQVACREEKRSENR